MKTMLMLLSMLFPGPFIVHAAENPIPADSMKLDSVKTPSIIRVNNRDSLVYFIRLEEIKTRRLAPEAEIPLTTAQELAAAGLYRDALDLLTEADTMRAGGAAPFPVKTGTPQAGPSPLPHWSTYTSVDYNDVIDTTAQEKQAIDSLARTGQDISPLSAYVEARNSIEFRNCFVHKLIPEIYVSDRKTYLQLGAQADAFNKIMLLEGSLQAAGLYDTGLAASQFSNENADALFKAEITTLPLRQPLVLSVPLSAEISRYRTQSATYFSFNEYKTAPLLSWSDDDLTWNVSLSGECGYRDALQDSSALVDSLKADTLNQNNTDLFYTAPFLGITYSTLSFSLELDASGRIEKYPYFTDPDLHREFETELHTYWRANPDRKSVV
jgi:hypothetical protein